MRGVTAGAVHRLEATFGSWSRLVSNPFRLDPDSLERFDDLGRIGKGNGKSRDFARCVECLNRERGLSRPCPTAIITKSLGWPATLRPTRSRKRIARRQENIIRMSIRATRRPRRASKRCSRPTTFSRTPRNGRSTTITATRLLKAPRRAPRAGAHEWTARQAGPGSGYDQSFDFNDFFGAGGAAGAGGGEGDQGGAGSSRSCWAGCAAAVAGAGSNGRRDLDPAATSSAPDDPLHHRHPRRRNPVRDRAGGWQTRVARRQGPPGIESGAKLRLRGQGEPGEQGGPRGDLTIHVEVEPHPYFTRDRRNLSVEVPISVSEATLGAKIEVPTLDGTKTLPVPAGTSSGQKLRLRGQGVPEAGGKPAGDLFLIPKIVVPKKLDETSQRACSRSLPNGIRSTRVKGSGDFVTVTVTAIEIAIATADRVEPNQTSGSGPSTSHDTDNPYHPS